VPPLVRSLRKCVFSPKKELEGMFDVIYPTEFGLLQISFPPNPSIRAWKGDQGMADGRWAVDGPKEVGLLPPINSAPKCWPN
jgi:hypothetical protein